MLAFPATFPSECALGLVQMLRAGTLTTDPYTASQHAWNLVGWALGIGIPQASGAFGAGELDADTKAQLLELGAAIDAPQVVGAADGTALPPIVQTLLDFLLPYLKQLLDKLLGPTA